MPNLIIFLIPLLFIKFINSKFTKILTIISVLLSIVFICLKPNFIIGIVTYLLLLVSIILVLKEKFLEVKKDNLNLYFNMLYVLFFGIVFIISLLSFIFDIKDISDNYLILLSSFIISTMCIGDFNNKHLNKK